MKIDERKNIETTIRTTQLRTWTVSFGESAPTSAGGNIGQNPREGYVRRIKGMGWNLPCQITDFLLRLFRFTGSFMMEDYAFSIEKNRMFLLKRSVDQVGYNYPP